VPTVCGSSPMVWRTIDKMIEAAKRRPELWPQGMPSSDEVCREIVASRQILEVEDFPVVLCHGDFKPSNVILKAGEESVTIIDHELAGPNYRGFDLMKVFRTDSKPCASSMKTFFATYLKTTSKSSSGQPSSDAQVAALVREAKMFEPLTWLEAACFFLAMPQLKPQQASRWNALALDRWCKYVSTKGSTLA